jgi:hypothetical protein
MKIITPTAPENIAWEGELAPLGATYKGAARLPRVTVGAPVSWPVEEALDLKTGAAWAPPANDHRYTLVRLSCTLHPAEDARTRYTQVTLKAYLRPRQGAGRVTAHDLYPQRVAIETKDKGTFTLGPELKFGETALSVLGIGAEIEIPWAFPIIEGYGLGEPAPYWRFLPHTGRPLGGCQSVYLVTDAPPDASGVRLCVELTADLETRHGLFRAGLSEEAQAHTCTVVG